MDFEDFDFGSLDAGEGAYDISSFLGDGGGQDIDFSGFDNLDLSSLLGGDSGGIDLSGIDMGPEAFDISSLLGGDSGVDFSGIDMGPEAFDIGGLDLSSVAEGVGDFDQAAPPSNMAELLTSMNPSSAENLAATDFNAL